VAVPIVHLIAFEDPQDMRIRLAISGMARLSTGRGASPGGMIGVNVTVVPRVWARHGLCGWIDRSATTVRRCVVIVV